jgi:protein TonB
MMARETILTPGLKRGRLNGGWMASRRRRFLLSALVLSVAVHVGAALLVVFLPRVLPHEAPPQQEGTVELLMVERKGAQPSQAGQQRESQSTQQQPEQQAEVPKQEPQPPSTQAAGPQAVPAPPVSTSATDLTSPTTGETSQKVGKADNKPDTQATATQSAPPKSQEGPVFDLAGTESESNAEVLGGRVVPASPDNRFRNRPPIYPVEAARQGQHGAVVVLIHVSDTGVATGIEVVQSSGVDSLDQAAVDAVRKWRFRPALQQGRSVPFAMPFRFVFDPY